MYGRSSKRVAKMVPSGRNPGMGQLFSTYKDNEYERLSKKEERSLREEGITRPKVPKNTNPAAILQQVLDSEDIEIHPSARASLNSAASNQFEYDYILRQGRQKLRNTVKRNIEEDHSEYTDEEPPLTKKGAERMIMRHERKIVRNLDYNDPDFEEDEEEEDESADEDDQDDEEFDINKELDAELDKPMQPSELLKEFNDMSPSQKKSAVYELRKMAKSEGWQEDELKELTVETFPDFLFRLVNAQEKEPENDWDDPEELLAVYRTMDSEAKHEFYVSAMHHLQESQGISLKLSQREFEQALVRWADTQKRMKEKNPRWVKSQQEKKEEQKHLGAFATQDDLNNFKTVKMMNPLVAPAMVDTFEHLSQWKQMNAEQKSKYVAYLNSGFTKPEYRKDITPYHWEVFLIHHLKRQFREHKETLLELQERYQFEKQKYLSFVEKLKKLDLQFE